MKLSHILKEVSDQQSREMVTGIADILRDVKDKGNREEIAKRMIKKFDREGVKYDAKEFMKLVGIATDKLQEIGFTKKSDFGFPYKRVTGAENIAMFEFSTGENDYQVWVQREENDGFQQGWILSIAFAVLEDTPVQFPGHRPGKSRSFEKEVNDPKNLYKVMNTVVNIAKDEAARLEKAGQEVIRVEFEPTKRQIRDKSGIRMDDPNDTRRANLYVAYLKKEFPDAEIKSTKNKGKIWVNIL